MNVSSQQVSCEGESETEANKQTVLDFYEAAINRTDVNAASAFIGECYVQHNPLIADGSEGLKAFVGFLKETFPDCVARSSGSLRWRLRDRAYPRGARPWRARLGDRRHLQA